MMDMKEMQEEYYDGEGKLYFRYENSIKYDGSLFKPVKESLSDNLKLMFKDIAKRTEMPHHTKDINFMVALKWHWSDCSIYDLKCGNGGCDECSHKNHVHSVSYVAGCNDGYEDTVGNVYRPVPLARIRGILEDLPSRSHNVLLMNADLMVINKDTGNEILVCRDIIDCDDLTVEVNTVEVKPLKRLLKGLGLI